MRVGVAAIALVVGACAATQPTAAPVTQEVAIENTTAPPPSVTVAKKKPAPVEPTERVRGAPWRLPTPMQPPDMMLARQRFKDGVTHYQSASFEEALAEFEGAYAASAHPAVLFNIASCLDRLGRAEDAIEAYEAFLNATPNAPQASTVQQRIDALRLQLSH